MRYFAVIVCLLLFTTIESVEAAQPTPLEVLSPQNLHRIEQIGVIGRGTVEELAWSPDEQLLGAAGSAGLWLYDVLSGHETYLYEHVGGVSDIDFSPDGRTMLTAGRDGTLRLWDVQTRAAQRVIDPYADLPCAPCGYELTSAKFAADGRSVWVGAVDAPLRVIDATTGALIVEDAERRVRSVWEIASSRTRTQFAIVERQSTSVTVWNTDLSDGFEPLQRIEVPYTVWNLAFVPGRNQLAVAGFVADEIFIVNIDSGERVQTIPGKRVVHVGPYGALATQTVEWQGDNPTWSLWVADLDLIRVVEYPSSVRVGRPELTDVRFSLSGRYIAASDSYGGIHVWRSDRLNPVMEVEGIPTAYIAASALTDRLYALIDIGSPRVESFSNGRLAPRGATLRLWNAELSTNVAAWAVTDYGLNRADLMYYDPALQSLFIADSAEPWHQLVYDILRGELVHEDQFSGGFITDAPFVRKSPSGTLTAVGSYDEEIRLYSSFDEINQITMPGVGPSLSFTPDGTRLITAGTAGVVRVWGVRSGVLTPE